MSEPVPWPLTADTDPLVVQVWAHARVNGMAEPELADASGVSPSTVGRLLHGHHAPTTRTARKLAAAVGCHLEVVPNKPGGKP
jgi:DNA-binding phage protein